MVEDRTEWIGCHWDGPKFTKDVLDMEHVCAPVNNFQGTWNAFC